MDIYDTVITLQTTEPLTKGELRVIKRLNLSWMESQLLKGCVIVNPSRRQGE